ncbi:hypothetical protein NIES4075_41340 [Tolypothrix sp. NIES-4075]|uniref:DUF7925 domain-containing protein n=1 Tax=Tolypothrix sp. NIES-4075 TaxID=2005459 RepID=UPI000B5C53D1|nr:hypothetical protein [Tolypothrix sp. NIES-4075]GAX43122.1 hypothetical protein NIES4075_41340 [Tolypothrix sp. NIES-4075]
MKPLSKVKKQSKLYRSLITTLLLANGIFQLVAPALAEGTAAGQEISNTATATYEDDSGTKINATSNTVTVKIAEVAGITITADGVVEAPTTAEGGTPSTPIIAGDKVYYNFTVKNVGNDPTKFHIPAKDKVNVNGPGTVEKLQYQKNDGTWADFNTAGQDTESIAAGDSIKVRVVVTVNNDAKKDDVIKVRLGNTTKDDGASTLQGTPNDDDVYTVDNADPSNVTGEIAGQPNGTFEASRTQQTTIGGTSYALATILKTLNTPIDDANTAKINDDKLTYKLSLKVESTDPTGHNIIPAALVGTKVNGLTGDRILVSDAIPKDTELAVAPTAPSGWEVVYSTTPAGNNANPLAANWSTSLPAGGLSAVTRIGFVNIPATVPKLAPGAAQIDFTVQVKVKSTVTATSLTVNNIAQVFGQTEGTPSVDVDNNGIPDNLVLDESGDQNPSNYSGTTGSMTPPAGTDTNSDGIPDKPPSSIPDGYIDDNQDLTDTGKDTNNNNTGTGEGGEANSVTLTQSNTTLLNGPKDKADAIGLTTTTTDPKYQNDDFTNKSTEVPAGIKPDSNQKIPTPTAVTFTNTVQNTTTKAIDISLIPTPPNTLSDLPQGTKVTISYGNDSKEYTWNGTEFQFAGGAIDQTSEYITIANVPAGSTVNYDVKVQLPENSPLSTDLNTSTTATDDLIGGFPVPITAFVDDAIPGLGTETARNTTIDQVYTGFLRMVKESRILPGDGPAVQGNDGTFSTTPKTPAPGNIIEYQITYTNISQAEPTGASVILNAKNVVITEDGTLSTVAGDGKNNWAKDNDRDGNMDTSHVSGSASDSKSVTIEYTKVSGSGTNADSDITKYVDTVTNVAPGTGGTFTFQRKVYKPASPNSSP